MVEHSMNRFSTINVLTSVCLHVSTSYYRYCPEVNVSVKNAGQACSVVIAIIVPIKYRLPRFT